MTELLKADGTAYLLCAARTPTTEGNICLPWKLSQGNRKGRKGRRVFGVRYGTGTTMRPDNCPHPENKVSDEPSYAVTLRKRMGL